MSLPLVTPKRVYGNPDAPILPNIDHVVVLMFENRSFDNMLGGLYPEQSRAGVYNGLKGDEFNYLNPSRPEMGYAKVWSGPEGKESPVMPYPDPGELFSDMNEQIFAADSDSGAADMGGFVWNYQKQPASPDKVCPTAANIMHYYAPGSAGSIPVTSALAWGYAVSDLWFASGPVQTLANRIFVHCATPGTYERKNDVYSILDNTDIPGYPEIEGVITAPTVFESLDNANQSWKVYYDDWPLSSVVDYVWNNWHWTAPGGNVYQFDNGATGDFFSDVRSDSLATYSFIEPCYTDTFDGTPNSNHPGGSDWNENPPPISIADGEALLHSVYAALCNGPNDLFKRTLLIVIYDEHGGLYDHLPPPAAVSPFGQNPVKNFDYSRYGVRVPALFINPYIQAGTIFCPPPGLYFDHTTIISTLLKKYQQGNLTPRDDDAPTLAGLIDTSNPPRILDPAAITPPARNQPRVRVPPQSLRSDPRRGTIAEVIKTALQNPKHRGRVLHQKGSAP